MADPASSVLVNIDVPDIDAGVSFYTRGLGFTLVRTLFDHSVAEMTLGQSKIYLIEQAEGTKPFSTANQTRTFERHWTPVHLDVVVADVWVAVERALAAGASRSGETTTHEWGKLTPLSDPFGHGICLVQFSSKGYDAVSD